MGGIRELRGRIKSVGNIKQITRAMEMVATTKLRRFQDRAVASRPYAQEIAGLVGRLSALLGDEVSDRPLFRKGAGAATACLLVTSDRGLCGPYNANILREMELWYRGRDEEQPVRFFVVGRKGYQYLTKRGRDVARFLVEPPLERVSYASAAHVSRILVEAFLSGEYADVHIFYTAFESVARYVPTRRRLLPISSGGLEGGKASDALLEPDADTIFDSVLPRYLETMLFNTLLESLTSEFASRRFSMKNATEAANDMQGVLKNQYNRLRQETITKELLDIVGGAEALR